MSSTLDATPTPGPIIPSGRGADRASSRRRAVTIVFAIGAFVMVLIAHAAMTDIDGDWSPAIPLVLRAFAAALALGTGLLKLAGYVGKRLPASLIVGTTFTGVGLIEGSRLVVLLIAQGGDTQAMLQVASRAGWAAGMALPLSLWAGMVLLPENRPRPLRGDRGILITVAGLITILGIVLPWTDFAPGAVDQQMLIVRPAAAWTVTAYLFAFALLWRRPDVSSTVDGRWLSFALYLGFLDQTLVAPFWDGTGIGPGTVDAALKVGIYLIAWTGVFISTMMIYRAQELAMRRARDEAAERARVEEALARQAARLTEANEELGQYAYLASHDLQEPLRMVTNYLQLIERRYADSLDEDGREFIAYAVDGARRMKQLTSDLLMYSRVGDDAAPDEVADASAAFDAAVQNLEVLIRETGAEVSRGELPVVEVAGSQLVQLFQNLIGNALKFRREGVIPRVRAEAARDGGFWRFTVTDNGIGIDAEYRERVFGVFQRLHRRDAYAGSGIGLAMCRKIVERHGGTIHVDSSGNEGSTFVFTVPVEPSPRRAYGADDEEDPELRERVSTLIERARELI